MIYLDGLYIGKVRFYVVTNLCVVKGHCDCYEMTDQLNAQIMGWA